MRHLLSWLPWWAGYWPPLFLIPVLVAGWGVEAAWSRLRPGRSFLGEWPDDTQVHMYERNKTV